jgi:maltoporin
MRRALQGLGLAGLLAIGFASTRAMAAEPTESDVQQGTEADTSHNTTQPKQAEQPAPVIEPSAATRSPDAQAIAPASATLEPPAKPKVGNITVTGYFRGGFGAIVPETAPAVNNPGDPNFIPMQRVGGRMVCFSLANPQGLVAKYRLGNECEVWSETHFTFVTYVGDDGVVSRVHFMPTVFIPTTNIGYSPTATVVSPQPYTSSTGATLSFPNLYVDLEGISWLHGGTAWIGTRYYKRESVYINDFFYWNPSGVGGGVEDINLGQDLRLSVAVFALDGDPGSAPNGAPQLPAQISLGFRGDIQLRGIKPTESSEIQVGFQYLADFSNPIAATDSYTGVTTANNTHSGWGVTAQYVQKLLGGDNKLAVQYGVGGGTGFGTLARFYYPDFSINHDLSEARFRFVDVATIQPARWLGAQAAFVYQFDDNFLGNSGLTTTWISTGGRVGFAPTTHFKVLGEAGYDRITKSNGSPMQFLAKGTIAVAICADRRFYSRPEMRLFYTEATWNAAAATVGVDSGRIYTDVYPQFTRGSIFGLQAETWW